MTPTKKFTVAEALKLAKQRISERRPDNAVKIYNAILEALPDHQEARFGLIAVNDAINCDYFPPLDNQQISDLVKLAAPEASNALLTKLYNNHGKDVVLRLRKIYSVLQLTLEIQRMHYTLSPHVCLNR